MAFLRQRILILLAYQPFWRAILVLSAAAIIYLATTSQPYPIPSAASDKVNHLLAFLQLAVVTRLAWPGLRKLWIVIGLLAFGLGIELVQAQLPYRTFAIADIPRRRCRHCYRVTTVSRIYKATHAKRPAHRSRQQPSIKHHPPDLRHQPGLV